MIRSVAAVHCALVGQTRRVLISSSRRPSECLHPPEIVDVCVRKKPHSLKTNKRQSNKNAIQNHIGTGGGSDCVRRFYNPTVNFVAVKRKMDRNVGKRTHTYTRTLVVNYGTFQRIILRKPTTILYHYDIV